MATSPSAADLLAWLKRVEEARRLVAEYDEWLASAPSLPDGAGQAETQPTESRGVEWHTTEALAALAVEVLKKDGGPQRASSVLKVLQEQGVSFVARNPVFSVSAALKYARSEGWVVMKGRGWWQIAPPGDPAPQHPRGSALKEQARASARELGRKLDERRA